MIFTYDLMSFYLDTIGCKKYNDRHNLRWEVFALFVAHRKGFDCSTLFADITANGNPHSDFTYLREVSVNELLDLIQDNGDRTRIDIAKFDDVINLICRKACNDINGILRLVEAPCFARISGFEVVVELRGNLKESSHLGPAEAIAYIDQLTKRYALNYSSKYTPDLVVRSAKLLGTRPWKDFPDCPDENLEYGGTCQEWTEWLRYTNTEWLECFDDDELRQIISEVKGTSDDEQQAVIYEWHQTAIVRQSGILDNHLK